VLHLFLAGQRVEDFAEAGAMLTNNFLSAAFRDED
jgi:hypothetical protein